MVLREYSVELSSPLGQLAVRVFLRPADVERLAGIFRMAVWPQTTQVVVRDVPEVTHETR